MLCFFDLFLFQGITRVRKTRKREWMVLILRRASRTSTLAQETERTKGLVLLCVVSEEPILPLRISLVPPRCACSQCARCCRSFRSGPALDRGRQAQSRGSFGVVSLLCVLDVSPTGRSPLEVTQRRLVLSGCAPSTSSPVLCMLLQFVPEMSFALSLNSRSFFSLEARFHSQLS